MYKVLRNEGNHNRKTFCDLVISAMVMKTIEQHTFLVLGKV
jgi:hypothetical protein